MSIPIILACKVNQNHVKIKSLAYKNTVKGYQLTTEYILTSAKIDSRLVYFWKFFL